MHSRRCSQTPLPSKPGRHLDSLCCMLSPRSLSLDSWQRPSNPKDFTLPALARYYLLPKAQCYMRLALALPRCAFAEIAAFVSISQLAGLNRERFSEPTVTDAFSFCRLCSSQCLHNLNRTPALGTSFDHGTVVGPRARPWRRHSAPLR